MLSALNFVSIDQISRHPPATRFKVSRHQIPCQILCVLAVRVQQGGPGFVHAHDGDPRRYHALRTGRGLWPKKNLTPPTAGQLDQTEIQFDRTVSLRKGDGKINFYYDLPYRV